MSQDALDRVKAFLARVRDVEGHFTLRFGETGITIGDLREVVDLVRLLKTAIAEDGCAVSVGGMVSDIEGMDIPQ